MGQGRSEALKAPGRRLSDGSKLGIRREVAAVDFVEESSLAMSTLRAVPGALGNPLSISVAIPLAADQGTRSHRGESRSI